MTDMYKAMVRKEDRSRDTFKRVWGFMCEHDARSLERSRGIQQQHKIQAKYFSTPPAKGQPQWVTKDIPLRTHAHMVSRSHGESSLASSQALSSTISSHSSRMQELQDEHRNPFLANTNRVYGSRLITLEAFGVSEHGKRRPLSVPTSYFAPRGHDWKAL